MGLERGGFLTFEGNGEGRGSGRVGQRGSGGAGELERMGGWVDG